MFKFSFSPSRLLFPLGIFIGTVPFSFDIVDEMISRNVCRLHPDEPHAVCFSLSRRIVAAYQILGDLYDTMLRMIPCLGVVGSTSSTTSVILFYER